MWALYKATGFRYRVTNYLHFVGAWKFALNSRLDDPVNNGQPANLILKCVRFKILQSSIDVSQRIE